ncbi:histone-fold-containing protein [Ochromonadaceae sp. CCMP2298]|nr:histone-fold-containing protein [Ochromonadaceae sp. CCMP2298]|mmetsp:Transcript_4035/g.9074  ORF Transcript_4035/g.9074 Transcript_4035/m.9074 type:complete len:87 (+) Transcript_4035:105-365(+)|eukprot:CAMPEP_0173205756 /NCGR_PEP_ID=MMETSP1141-20130122/20938_1 /TAXON_ID=483371 /ORGANISM="non described non described, Strain CCMP2298" /LENGTH=86 /DNA_ID=CAMNT_0014131733 /DNA_START=55 /DNA_END=315 /DNA_ORIENTATION=-
MADSKFFEIPKSSVRKIMKMNDEVANVSADAAALTTKSVEMFIADLVEASHQICVANKRKTIKVDDLLLAIAENPNRYEFLNESLK